MRLVAKDVVTLMRVLVLVRPVQIDFVTEIWSHLANLVVLLLG